MIRALLILLVLGAPAQAAEPKEMPDFWYDLIVAEIMAAVVAGQCDAIDVDRLSTYRLRNKATGRLAEQGIHNRSPKAPLSIEKIVATTMKIGLSLDLVAAGSSQEKQCETAQELAGTSSELGRRIKLVAK